MHVCRVGQNHVYIRCIYVKLVISLPNLPYIHRIYIYMVLANSIYTVLLAGRSPNIRCIYTALANPTHMPLWHVLLRFGQSVCVCVFVCAICDHSIGGLLTRQCVFTPYANASVWFWQTLPFGGNWSHVIDSTQLCLRVGHAAFVTPNSVPSRAQGEEREEIKPQAHWWRQFHAALKCWFVIWGCDMEQRN